MTDGERNLAERDERTTWILRRTAASLDSIRQRRLHAIGLNASQYSVLSVIESTPGASGAELARLLSVSPQAVIEIIKAMVAAGFVERRLRRGYSRVLDLFLTSSGVRTLRQAAEVLDEIERQVTEALGEDRRDELLISLSRLAAYAERES